MTLKAFIEKISKHMDEKDNGIEEHVVFERPCCKVILESSERRKRKILQNSNAAERHAEWRNSKVFVD